MAHHDERRHRLLFRIAQCFQLARISGPYPPLSLLNTIIGTALIASGTAALNQWFERDADRKMRRTAGRPLPLGRLTPSSALAFGAALSVAGFMELWLGVNLLSGASALSRWPCISSSIRP